MEQIELEKINHININKITRNCPEPPSTRQNHQESTKCTSNRHAQLERCLVLIFHDLMVWRSPHVKRNLLERNNSTCNYLLQVYNRYTRTWCEICLKLTIKTPERHWHRSDVFIVNFEYISLHVLVFLLFTLNK